MQRLDPAIVSPLALVGLVAQRTARPTVVATQPRLPAATQLPASTLCCLPSSFSFSSPVQDPVHNPRTRGIQGNETCRGHACLHLPSLCNPASDCPQAKQPGAKRTHALLPAVECTHPQAARPGRPPGTWHAPCGSAPDPYLAGQTLQQRKSAMRPLHRRRKAPALRGAAAAAAAAGRRH